jgi:hypothetical protein
MQAALRRLCWLGALLLPLAGCHSTTTYSKPPLHEEYILPPSDDPRFSSPPTYPKETLDTNNFRKEEQNKQTDPNKPPERFGAGPGGGMGMGRGY